MHPTTLIKDTSYWTLFQVYDPSNPGQAKAPDSLPTAVVYKNGTANGDSVTITNISTGLYKLTYNPASEVEGDFFELVVTAVISSVNYPEVINFVVKAVERGTDGALTALGTDSISAAAVSDGAVTKIQNGLASATALAQTDMTVQAAAQNAASAATNTSTIIGYLDTEIAAILEDTGTTLPAQIAAISGAVEVVVSASSSVLDTIDDGGNITLRRGDRVSFSLTLGNVTGRTGEKLFFTIKRQNTNDTDDSNAIVQITESTGAVLVNGSSAGVTAADASITVSNETTGATTFVIQDSITTLFPVGSGWHYDVQMIRSDGKAVTLTYGSVAIVADTTRRKTI